MGSTARARSVGSFVFASSSPQGPRPQAPADLSLAMSHVNSEPRGALGFATPARAFRAMLGADAEALLDAYGVEDVPVGELDLTPGLIARARAERGDAPLS